EVARHRPRARTRPRAGRGPRRRGHLAPRRPRRGVRSHTAALAAPRLLTRPETSSRVGTENERAAPLHNAKVVPRPAEPPDATRSLSDPTRDEVSGRSLTSRSG